MDIRVFDSAGRELNQAELQQMKIWNPAINSACIRVKHAGAGSCDVNSVPIEK